ncbi:hypothetical protein HRbin33_00001 [bacterium HR33]|nr:hypothetical protein HRbin33_00001 [bacterium HR33]
MRRSYGCFARIRRVSAPIAVALLVSGCFQYVPVSGDVIPEPGVDVRATLSPPLAFNLGTFTLNEVTTVEGHLVDSNPDSLGLWVKWFKPRGEDRYYGNNVGYYIPRANVAKLEVWRPSPKRTIGMVALTAGILTGFYAVLQFAVQNEDPTRGGMKDPGTISQSLVFPR